MHVWFVSCGCTERSVASFMNSCMLWRGEGRSWDEGEWCRPQGLSIRTDKINIIKKNRIFCFSLLSQTNVNSISTCDFAKFIVSVRDTHCDHSRGATKKEKNLLAAIHYIIIYSKS